MSAKTARQGLHQPSGTGAFGGNTGRDSLSRGRRQQAAAAFRAVSDRLSDVAQAGAQQIKANPFAAVAGAAAVSAGVALLLPSGRREAEMMGEVAGKLSDVARDAADTAVEAARSQVETLAQGTLASVGGAVVQAVVSGDGAEGNARREASPQNQERQT